MNTKHYSAEWFEATVSFEKIMENGEAKRVAETIAIDAMSFTEAESKAVEEYAPYEEMKVQAIKIAPYKELFVTDKEEVTPTFYNVKVCYITLDEKTAKEKRTTVKFLIGASNLEEARKIMSDELSSTMGDWSITGVTESKVIDFYAKE